MSYTVESKNQLAKLLATENITIEHRTVQTASFDMKTRVLTCPIWKTMSGEMYDLFMGHEVGHALDTPLDGWHDTLSKKGRKYKHFLNVVEDARIEKKMKRRYPGLKKSFYVSYKELVKQDFFGIKNRNINSMSLIDKINLHFKCGSELNVQFTESEMEYVELVESCESWSDVVSVTDKLFGYCAKEQKENRKKKTLPEDLMDDPDLPVDGDEFMSPEEDDFADDDGSADDESDEVSDDVEDSDTERDYFGTTDSESDFEPTSETDEHFRKMEHKLLDDKCRPYEYLNVPKSILERIVTPQKRVHELLNHHLSNNDKKSKNLAEFKKKNEAYISLLVKEFEMHKAAKSFAKQKLASTGDIDLNRIHRYKMEDNIFRKITKVSAGKSHGLVLLLDRSGSMMHNMEGAIEQIMVLAMFCRRVNIPFVVYGFGTSRKGRMMDFPTEESVSESSFHFDLNSIKLRNVFLREYLNSEMKTSEFNSALSNLCTLKRQYDYSGYLPRSELLSDTPLVQAMVAMRPIVDTFKSTKKLDIVNLVIVHDGDADHVPQYFSNSTNYILCDKEYKFQTKIDFEKYRLDAVRTAIFEWFSHVTDTKVFGFFIVENNPSSIRGSLKNRLYVEDKILSSLKRNDLTDVLYGYTSKLRSEKFLVSTNPAYEKFFFILGGKNLVTEDFSLKQENLSVRRLKTEFLKQYEKRKVNRVLVNQFIQGIAK